MNQRETKITYNGFEIFITRILDKEQRGWLIQAGPADELNGLDYTVFAVKEEHCNSLSAALDRIYKQIDKINEST